VRLAKFEVFLGKTDRQHDYQPQWYWRLVGGNGEILAVSESFPSKSNAKRAAKRARVLSRFALVKVVD